MLKVFFVLFCLLTGNLDPTVLTPFNSNDLIQKVYVSLHPSSIADRDKILFDSFQKLSEDVVKNMTKDLEATFPNIKFISSKFLNFSHIGISFNIDSNNKSSSLITGVVVSGTFNVYFSITGKNENVARTANLSDVVLIVLTVVRDNKPPVYSFFGFKEKKDTVSWEVLKGCLVSGNYKLFKTNNSHFDDIGNNGSTNISANLNDLMNNAVFSAAVIQEKFEYVDKPVDEKKEESEKRRNGVNVTDLEWYLLIGGVLLAVVLLLVGVSCCFNNKHNNRKMTGDNSNSYHGNHHGNTGGNVDSSATNRRSNTHNSINDSNSNICNDDNSNANKKTSRSRSRSVIPI